MTRGYSTDDAAPEVAPVPFAPGTIIDGRYRIEERLGAGGNGTVFRCFDQKLGAVVALKVVASDGDLVRWRREVAMARQITDRNVCRVHDLGETAELRYVTMELVEGTGLREQVGHLEPAAARALFDQIVAGTAAIHAAGVVHRDLKPENIVVATDGRAVIVDFGLAKSPRSSQLGPVPEGEVKTSPDAQTRELGGAVVMPVGATVTHAGIVLGTPRYMAPEQAAGELVDARADVWALALVGHELLAGAFPELGPNGHEIAASIDERIAAILKQCLAADPAARFADAREVRAAITPKRRRWPWIAGGAGVIAATTAITVVATMPRDDAELPQVPKPVPRLQQLTTTSQWPTDTPVSVAIDPAATKLAYATGGRQLFVRPISGGAPEAWRAPELLDQRGKPVPLTALAVAGWFADGTLAVVATTATESYLVRARRDGSEQLHRVPGRARFAVTGDRIAVASERSIDVFGGASVAEIPAGERVVALAWSEDGKRLAWMRRALNDDTTLVVVEAPAKPVELWRGKTEGLIDPLLAFAGERIAFSVRDAEVTAIKTIDPATGELIVIDDVPDHVGAGSAARGTLLFVRGPAKQTVQIRDQYGNRIVRLDAKGSASHVAGWTSDGRAVFHDGERVMLATGDEKRRKWTVAPLPGSEPGDIPEAVGGDAVIVRHDRVLWRVMLDGTRSRLADVEGRVRCSSVCVIQRAGSAEVTWAELDATTGAVGTVVYRRPLGARVPSFALSRDGALLAIADGGDHIDLRDRATGAAVEAPRGGAAWHSVAFDDSNAIWATAAEVDGHWSGLKRFEQRTGGAYLRGTTLVMDASDALRWLWEPSATGSDQTVRIAVSAEELYLEVWLATGL